MPSPAHGLTDVVASAERLAESLAAIAAEAGPTPHHRAVRDAATHALWQVAALMTQAGHGPDAVRRLEVVIARLSAVAEGVERRIDPPPA